IFVCLFALLIPMAQTERVAAQGADKKSKDLSRAAARSAAASEMLREIVEPPATIPIYILTTAKAMAVISSRPNFGELASNEDGVGLVVARDQQTGQWSAPIFLTLKGGKIDDKLDDRKLNDLFKL